MSSPNTVRTLRSGPVKQRQRKKPPRKRTKKAIENNVDFDTEVIRLRNLADIMADNENNDGELTELEQLKLHVEDLKNSLAVFKHEVGEAADNNAPSYIFDPLTSIPVYDSTRMTPSAYLSDIEEHLTWKHVDKEKWLLLVTRMFDKTSDISRWWRETKSTVKSWDEFKTEFLRYEGSTISKDALYSKLFSKRQNITEAFETYAWDVSGLYQKIDHKIAVSQVIDRIMNSALPEISVSLRNFSYKSISELIFKAREIISDINKIRQFEGKTLLRARSTDPVPSKIETSYSDRNKNRKTWHNSSNSSRNSQSSSSSSAQTEQTQSKNPAETATAIPPSSNAQGQSSSASFQRSDRNKKEDRECFYCKKKGHVIKDCRKRLYNENSKQQGSSGSNAKNTQEPEN